MEHPKPLKGPQGPLIEVPGLYKEGRAVQKSTNMIDPMKKLDQKQTVFRPGFLPEKLPQAHTKARVELIYNTLKGLLLMGHHPKFGNKEKMKAGFREIKAANPGLYDRVKTYYDRLTEEQIMFFIGPRPQFMDDGKLAIWDHNRDNPVLQAVLKEEKPKDVDPETLKPKSKLVLPHEFGGILR